MLAVALHTTLTSTVQAYYFKRASREWRQSVGKSLIPQECTSAVSYPCGNHSLGSRRQQALGGALDWQHMKESWEHWPSQQVIPKTAKLAAMVLNEEAKTPP